MVYLLIFGLYPSATVTPSVVECLAVGQELLVGRAEGSIACYDAKNNTLTPAVKKDRK